MGKMRIKMEDIKKNFMELLNIKMSKTILIKRENYKYAS